MSKHEHPGSKQVAVGALIGALLLGAVGCQDTPTNKAHSGPDSAVLADCDVFDQDQSCPTPGGLSASPAGGGFAALVQWQPEASGELQLRWEGGGERGTVVLEAAAGQYVIVGLQPETPYALTLTRACASGAATASDGLTTGPSIMVPYQVTVPTSGEGDEVALFNCFSLDMGKEGSVVAAVDRQGRVLWAWRPGEGAEVLTDVDWIPERQTLLVNVFGKLTEVDLAGQVRFESDDVFAHHDLDYLPGLGFAFLYYRLASGYEEYDPRVTEGIRIVDPQSGEVIWDWALEEVLAADDYHLPDIVNTWFIGADWTHANDLDYLPERSQFMLNIRNLNRILFIDYPSGEVSTALGDPDHLCAGQWSHSHDPEWLSLEPDRLAGRLLMFDNGLFRAGGEEPYSRALELEIDAASGTCEVVWEYRETPDFYAEGLSSAYRLASGNTLITDGINGRFLEVDHAGSKLWEVLVPDWWIYQAKPVPRSFFERGQVERIAQP